VYEIKNSATATAADVKFILDISYKVELSAERAFHYLAFAPDFEATGCFYATYNKKSDGHNLQASASADYALRTAHCVVHFLACVKPDPTEVQLLVAEVVYLNLLLFWSVT
jgi:hypothetical protein